MATKRILICDTCGRKEKKDKTGWISPSVGVKIYGKKWIWWKNKKFQEIYLSRHFCGLLCFNVWISTLVMTGKLSRKVEKLLKKQRKSK